MFLARALVGVKGGRPTHFNTQSQVSLNCLQPLRVQSLHVDWEQGSSVTVARQIRVQGLRERSAVASGLRGSKCPLQRVDLISIPLGSN